MLTLGFGGEEACLYVKVQEKRDLQRQPPSSFLFREFSNVPHKIHHFFSSQKVAIYLFLLLTFKRNSVFKLEVIPV